VKSLRSVERCNLGIIGHGRLIKNNFAKFDY
jgi:hypothetical protein